MTVSAFQEEIISSNKNYYKRVTGGAAVATDFVIVDNLVDFDKFTPGDTVLLIQMKGVHSLVIEDGTYGILQDVRGSPGRYEFLIVEDAIPGDLKIVFTNPIANSYDLTSDLQLVRVPSYYSATVVSDLVCEPWDSVKKTGGVLTMIVGRKLKLNSNINVTGKGFVGGAIVTGDGICSETNIPALRKFSYDASFTNSGLKGEGLVSRAWINFSTNLAIYPGYAKGKGANFNAGGGGNGRFSGGAGGSHIGTGGRGGTEYYDICSSSEPNIGGRSVTATLVEGGLFLGGGGGGSTFKAPGTGINGGRGGGIVIIMANEIDGNGYTISADGEMPPGAASGISGPGGGGAGGGGGGGSVAIYLDNFSVTNLILSAKGGQGGRSNGDSGEGGGGGGGLIWTNIGTPGNVTSSVAGGAKGQNIGIVNSLAGSSGLKTTSVTYTPKLNGFLFNSIRSSGTNNLVDSICSNNKPFSIIGTKPVGGSGNYSYIWQKQNDSGGPIVVLDSSTLLQNYNFTAPEPDTFFIRRVVRDNVTLLRDISKWLKIIVQPKIQNNTVKIYSDIVSLTDTICWNGDPRLIDQVLPDLVIPASRQPKYTWQDSSQSATWGAVTGTQKSYNPPAGLTAIGNKYYRRKVAYGRCADSTAIVRVTVLDTIKKNLITTRLDTICHGGLFLDLNGDPGLTGGDNTFRYLWQYSQTGGAGSWSTAAGGSTGANYNPDETSAMYPGKVYYRRKVFSGAHNVCVDSSKAAIRVDWPAITANNIAADQIICSGSIPVAITGAEPLNGAGPGSFKYTWQDSSKFHNWTNITGYIKVPGQGYSPPALTDTTSYRRIAYSSKCTDISKAAVKRVHNTITSFNVSLLSGVWDTTICSGSTPKLVNGFTPGAESGSGNPVNNIYQWITCPTKTGTYTDVSGATLEDYQPGALTNATATPIYFYYKRKLTNGACSVISDSAGAIKVLPKITNNIVSASQAVCYNSLPAALTGPSLTGGAGGTPTWLWQQSINSGASWSTAVNTPNTQNYSPPALTAPTQYRRLIYSGPANCCRDTSNVLSISINPLPVAAITAAIDTICEGLPGQTFNLQITGSTASPWSVIYKENATSKPAVPVNNAISDLAVSPVIPGASTPSSSFVYALVSIRDANNCNAVPASLTGSRELFVHKVPVAVAGADDAICGPTYKLHGSKNVGTASWTYPGVPVINTTPNGDDLEVTVDMPFTPSWSYKHKFYFNVINWNCPSKDSVDITFYLVPDKADAGADTTIYSLDKEVVLPVVIPTVGTGEWSIVSGGASQKNESTFTNLSAGNNIFEWRITNVIDECFSADQVTITVNELIIPNAFSPNDDEWNETFEIQGLDLDNSDVTLTILNSAGTEIYRTTNINDTYTPWSGESRGTPVPDGTYYYLLIIESNRNDSMLKKSGFLILKRDKLE